jgi:hypothetical protein
MNDDYCVVTDVLTKHRNELWKMTQRNMNCEFIGFNIIDDIRLEQIAEIDKCIKMWKERNESA